MYTNFLENELEGVRSGGPGATMVRYVHISAADVLEKGLKVESSTEGLVNSGANSTGRLEIRFIFNSYTISENWRFRFSDVTFANALHGVFDLAQIGTHVSSDPWPLLEQRHVVHDTLGSERFVIFWAPGTLSALDAAQIARSRAVGATAVYRARLDDRALTFEAGPNGVRDRETGSRWNFFGTATAGPLTGRRLAPIQHVDAFWFAWAAFNPATTIWETP